MSEGRQREAPPTSSRLAAAAAALAPLMDFYARSRWATHRHTPHACDFVLGNPQELPLPGLVDALREALVPRDRDWFAYQTNEAPAQAQVAAELRRWRGIDFAPEDVALTRGAFGALAAAVLALCEPGDEVAYFRPGWFHYGTLVRGAGAVPVPVPLHPDTFDLDLGALARAVTPRTRVVVVNSPHNPTGRVYPPAQLRALSALLEETSRRNGRTVYLLSDEPYARLLYPGVQFRSPTEFYPDSLIAYSYGKVLLAPGQRVGWLALSPHLRARAAVREAVLWAQIAQGWNFPDNVSTYALPALEHMSVDMAALQRRRDRMVEGLRAAGYMLHVPEASFYLLPRTPRGTDAAFVERLAAHDVFVLPGDLLGAPGRFRISLTATDAMVERALPVFARVMAAGA